MSFGQQDQGHVGQVQKDQWHLDKRVPIALIFAILAQTIAGVWWAATLQGTVDDLSRRQLASEVKADGGLGEARIFADRLARMEERGSAQSDSLRRIEAQIAIIIENRRVERDERVAPRPWVP